MPVEMHCFIDDIAVIAENEKNLTNMIKQLFKKYYMEMNEQKTKMVNTILIVKKNILNLYKYSLRWYNFENSS